MTTDNRSIHRQGIRKGMLPIDPSYWDQLVRDKHDLLAALEQCLTIVDAYRRISGGDGDIAAMNARAAIAKAKGE